MPTITAAAQAASPQGVVIDGVDLLPLATGEGANVWSRETLFWQSGYYRAVRHGDWKLQVSERPNTSWLYNLADDPTEQKNLARSHPDKLVQLKALLDAHKASGHEPLYPYIMEAPVAVDKSLAERFEEGDEYTYWPN
jgi:arylsulfatase A-like enzyme